MSSLSIQQQLANAKQKLLLTSATPALDASVLLCHVLAKPSSYLLTWPEQELTVAQQQSFESLLARRLAGEPIAYLTGEREFWSLPLKVSPATLIPRPDTECLVEMALVKAKTISGAILDLGTGTGAIALALASELPETKIVAVDIQPQAVQLAQENASLLGFKQVTFLQGSWFEPLPSGTKFALIVSNPPYIDANDPHLQQGDVRFEPASALVAAEQGLADIKRISEQARHFLLPMGWLLFEHGYQQAEQVRECLSALGYHSVSSHLDYAGNPRISLGQWRG